ncbi:MAG: hypothetical protein NXI08_13060 [bacterium]|nr:hypothetical protein [bacterium]
MKKIILTTIFLLGIAQFGFAQYWDLSTNTLINNNSGDIKLKNSTRLIFNGTNQDQGIIYNAVENNSPATRYALKFDYTNNSSYPYLTNRTPFGKVVIKTGTALGSAENTRLTINGGDGTVNAWFTDVKLGIGTSTPTSNLHISGGATGNTILKIESDTDNSGSEDDHPQLQLIQDGGMVTGTIGYATIGSDNNQLLIENGWNNDEADILFRKAGVTNMIIEGSGKVGIGTSSPTYELDVSGDIGVSQYLRHNDDTNTYVRFQSDDLQLYAGGDQVLRADEDSSPTLTFGSVWDTKFNGSTLFIGGTQGSNNGKVGIGTANPAYKLTVAGTISSREIVVEETAGADFVFEENYDLPSLTEIESFVQVNKHLPGIAPASQMIEEGVKVGELQIQLLQKIEELTLHMIQQNKVNQQQMQLINDQSEMIKALKHEIEILRGVNHD